MADWFKALAAGNELPVHAASELEERGFVVHPGLIIQDRDDTVVDSAPSANTAWVEAAVE